MAEARLPRRRRSAARAPFVFDPVEIPDDAAGRVEVIAVRAPADVVDPADAVPPPPAPPPLPSPLERALAAEGGWIAVGVIAGLIAVLFIVGMVATR